jgi:hypothetical protein
MSACSTHAEIQGVPGTQADSVSKAQPGFPAPLPPHIDQGWSDGGHISLHPSLCFMSLELSLNKNVKAKNLETNEGNWNPEKF